MSALQRTDAVARSPRIQSIGLVVAVVACFVLELQSPRLFGGARRLAQPVVFGMLAAALAMQVIGAAGIPRRLLSSAPFITAASYVAWLLLTTLWSVAPTNSAYHGILLLAMLAVSAFVGRGSLGVTLRSAIAMSTLVCALSWAVLLAGLDIALLPSDFWRLQGIAVHPQRLALISGVGLLASVSGVSTGRVRLSGALIVCCALLLATLAATLSRVFTLAIIVAGAFLVVRVSGRARLFLILGALVAVVAAAALAQMGSVAVDRGDSDGTLTGRFAVWALAVDMIRQQPVLGVGFGGFLTRSAEAMPLWAPAHAHNMWLHAMAETGVVGVLLLCGVMISVAQHARSYRLATAHVALSGGLLIVTLLGGLTGLVVGDKLSLVYGLLLVVVAQERVEMNVGDAKV